MAEQPPPALSFAETTVEALLAAAIPKIDRHGRSPAELEDEVRVRVSELVERNTHLALDAPTLQWIHRASVVLAVYQVLGPLAGGDEVISILRDAMTEPFREKMSGYLLNRFGISQDAPAQAFDRISENFKTRGEERFGKAFLYVQDVQDANRSFTNIRRCFFNDFFRANGAAEVTRIFCALDNVWVDSLHETRYGVRFDRPTNLAQGADACRFQFSRLPASETVGQATVTEK
jgi:L-2-amino-thiazoline-4-carboxylic acid hydrolase